MMYSYEKISKVLAASLSISAEELVRSYDRATAADLTAVSELMRLGFGEVDNLKLDVIAWRYFIFSNNISDVFVLRYQGKLIGAIGAEPIKVKVGDNEYDGIVASDIVVHPEHLKRGIGAWMNLHLQHTFPVVVAMGSNEHSNTMVRRLFKPMSCRHQFKMLFSITHYLEMRKWNPVAVKVLSLLSVLPLSLIRIPFLVSLPKGYTLEVTDNTSNLPLFFNDPEYQPRQLCMAMRSAKYCQWRYDLNPKSQFTVFQLCADSRYVGYAIVKNPPSGIAGDWQLMDWDFLPSYRDEKHLRILLTAVVRDVVKRGAQSLSVMATDTLSCKSLQSTGFSLRAVDDGFFLWAQEHVDPAVRDEKLWFLSLCDTDESL